VILSLVAPSDHTIVSSSIGYVEWEIMNEIVEKKHGNYRDKR
jgi:hypothetical protein